MRYNGVGVGGMDPLSTSNDAGNRALEDASSSNSGKKRKHKKKKVVKKRLKVVSRWLKLRKKG